MAKAQKDNRNMKRLKDEQQVRQRPAPIFGTNDEHGAFNSVNEILTNSVDEAREGYGNVINVSVAENDVVTVEDFGRGLPMDWNEDEQMYNWQLALCTLYASGKYDSAQYGQAAGLNGLGLTSTQYASDFFDVWSTYDGKTRYVHFEKGRPVGDMQVTKANTDKSSTKITFRPDPIVFPALKIRHLTADMFLKKLNSQAMLIAGLRVNFQHYELSNPVSFYYENGMPEYVDNIAGENAILGEAFYAEDEVRGTDDAELEPELYKLNMRLSFNFCRDRSLVEVFHNGSLMFERGETVEALEDGISRAFTDVARELGKISSARNDRFLFKDIEPMLICIGSTDAPGNRTWFKNQTKGAINNPFIGSSFRQFVYNKVRRWLENGGQQANKVIGEAIINKQAREEGAEVSKKVIRNLTKNVSFSSKPKDFRDCSSKNRFERELYIVEGLSALGSVKLACNSKFQAVMPVRGKPINCLKERITRVLNNDIIIDLYRVLGCGMEINNKNLEDIPKFDINKLNWGKVIICTDADVDGMHIRCLLLTMFYILSPSLLKAGKVFIAETPLYEMTYKKETKFAFDENEKTMWIEYFKGLGASPEQIKIQRSKGLGENDPEMMSISTMKPETRRLIPIDFPETDAELSELNDEFKALLGDDIETRRELIETYFSLTRDDAE